MRRQGWRRRRRGRRRRQQRPFGDLDGRRRHAEPLRETGTRDLLRLLRLEFLPLRLADAHAKNGTTTYMYEFAWRSPQFDGRLGACHALEIAFVFDTLGNRTAPLMGTDPPLQLADAMHAAWVAFAATGDPGWPAYDIGRRATMRFDTTSAIVNDPLAAERALWAGAR